MCVCVSVSRLQGEGRIQVKRGKNVEKNSFMHSSPAAAVVVQLQLFLATLSAILVYPSSIFHPAFHSHLPFLPPSACLSLSLCISATFFLSFCAASFLQREKKGKQEKMRPEPTKGTTAEPKFSATCDQHDHAHHLFSFFLFSIFISWFEMRVRKQSLAAVAADGKKERKRKRKKEPKNQNTSSRRSPSSHHPFIPYITLPPSCPHAHTYIHSIIMMPSVRGAQKGEIDSLPDSCIHVYESEYE